MNRFAFLFGLVVACTCLFSPEAARADQIVTLRDGVLTVRDIGTPNSGMVRIRLRRNNTVLVEEFTNSLEIVEHFFNAANVDTVNVFMGIGDDTVMIDSQANVGSNLVVQTFPNIEVNVQTGTGDDTVLIEGLGVGSLDVRSGTGIDTIRVEGIFEDLNVVSGANSDSVRVDDCQIDGNMQITTGAGADFLVCDGNEVSGITNIDTGPRDDRISVENSSFTGPVIIDSGNGDDRISVNDVNVDPNTFASPLRVFAGSGDDSFVMGTGDYFFVRLEGGPGDDGLFFNDFTFFRPAGATSFQRIMFDDDRQFRILSIERNFSNAIVVQ